MSLPENQRRTARQTARFILRGGIQKHPAPAACAETPSAGILILSDAAACARPVRLIRNEV